MTRATAVAREEAHQRHLYALSCICGWESRRIYGAPTSPENAPEGECDGDLEEYDQGQEVPEE